VGVAGRGVLAALAGRAVLAALAGPLGVGVGVAATTGWGRWLSM
jgi:hypothetical protein